MQGATRVQHVAQLLAELDSRCDTGFAIAAHIRYNRPTLLYQTYPQDWIDHYNESGFMLTDPVVVWGLSNTGVVSWDELAKNDPTQVMRSAKKFGLENGWTYALGAAQSRSITGITRSYAPFTAQELLEINLITDQIHDLTKGFADFEATEQTALRLLKA